MVAFANAEGGLIILGVDDDRVVRGLPEARLGDIETWVVNIATENCDPPIRPILRREAIPDLAGIDALVMLVEVRRGLYVHRNGGDHDYLRVGSTKRDLTATELARLFQQRGRAFVFDEQPVPTATEADLDRDRLEAHFGMGRHALPGRDLLRNTRVVVTDEDGSDRPTVAGLVAFGKSPTDHLRSAYLEAAVYRGTELTSDALVHASEYHPSR